MTERNEGHTPGPWEARGAVIWVADRAREGTTRIGEAHGSGPEARANALLLASAPILLDALERYMAGHPCEATDECPTKNEALAATQKAKGQQ